MKIIENSVPHEEIQREQISWLSFPGSPNLKNLPHDMSENILRFYDLFPLC